MITVADDQANDQLSEALEAKRRSEQHLRTVQQRQPLTSRMAALMVWHREKNHFAERFREAFERDR